MSDESSLPGPSVWEHSPSRWKKVNVSLEKRPWLGLLLAQLEQLLQQPVGHRQDDAGGQPSA